MFAAQGLDVQWSDWRGGVAATRAVLEGEADVAYAGFGPVERFVAGALEELGRHAAAFDRGVTP